MSSKPVVSLSPLPPTLPGGGVVMQQAAPEDPKPQVAADAISLSPRASQASAEARVEPAAPAKRTSARIAGKPVARPKPQPAKAERDGPPAPAVAKPAVGFKFRITGLASFFSTALANWIFNPRALVGHVRAVFGQVYLMAAGTHRVKTVAEGLSAARKEGQAGAYLKAVLAQAGGVARRTAASTWSSAVGFFSKAKPAAALAPKAAPVAVLEANRGLIGWTRLARAEGASPLKAVAVGFKRTLETGGDMPTIVGQAREMQGAWGRAFEITGKVARLAPLLNVPIAVLDVKHAFAIANNTTITRRDRISQYGQACFSTTAAVLSVAAFLVPGPIELGLLTAASVAGFGSVGWSIFSSRVVVNFYKRVTNALHVGPHHDLEPAPVKAS